MMKKLMMMAVLALAALAESKAEDVEVTFLTPSIVHVVKGEATKSLVVTAKAGNVPLTRHGNSLSSAVLTVKKDAETGRLTFLTAKGKVLLREEGWSLIRKTIDEWQVSQTFKLDKDEAIYGLGTIQNGKMNRRGEHKRMEQSNLEDFQNVLQSIKGWGLYWENYSPTQFDDDASGMTFTSEAGKGVDYYFMYGGSADGVIAQMRWLTGDVPMFPLWTYGFWPCGLGTLESQIDNGTIVYSSGSVYQRLQAAECGFRYDELELVHVAQMFLLSSAAHWSTHSPMVDEGVIG